MAVISNVSLEISLKIDPRQSFHCSIKSSDKISFFQKILKILTFITQFNKFKSDVQNCLNKTLCFNMIE